MRIIEGKPVEEGRLRKATQSWARIGAFEPPTMAEMYKIWRSRQRTFFSEARKTQYMKFKYNESRELERKLESELYA